MDLQPDEIMPAVTPLGYTANKKSLKETMMRKGVKADVRYAFSDLFFQNDFSTPLADDGGKICKALEMVMGGEINFDVECNPLHGPRVRAVAAQFRQPFRRRGLHLVQLCPGHRVVLELLGSSRKVDAQLLGSRLRLHGLGRFLGGHG